MSVRGAGGPSPALARPRPTAFFSPMSYKPASFSPESMIAANR
jgi:hypothetical protein